MENLLQKIQISELGQKEGVGFYYFTKILILIINYTLE